MISTCRKTLIAEYGFPLSFVPNLHELRSLDWTGGQGHAVRPTEGSGLLGAPHLTGIARAARISGFCLMRFEGSD